MHVKSNDFVHKFWCLLSRLDAATKEQSLQQLRELKKMGMLCKDAILRKGGHCRTDAELFVISFLAWHDNYAWSAVNTEELHKRIRKIQKEFKLKWVKNYHDALTNAHHARRMQYGSVRRFCVQLA